MMKIQLNNWQHALLSYAILILGLFVLYAVFISPVITSRANFSDRVENLELQLAKYKQIEKQFLILQKQIATLNQNSPQKIHFLEEKAYTLATADLQEFLKSLIETNEGSLISTQPIKDQDKGPFPKVIIRVNMLADINALQKILYQIESSTLRLFIDNMIIQKRMLDKRPDNQKNGEQLDIKLDITGYIYS